MKILNFMIGSTLAQFDPFMSKFNVDFVVNSEPAKMWKISWYFIAVKMIIMKFKRHLFYNSRTTTT